MMRYWQYLLVLLLLLLPPTSFAASLTPEQVPEPLKPWVDWALHDTPERNCPYVYDANARLCAWPGGLELNLHEQGGTFVQQWQVFGESTIRLPGDAQHWPYNVRNEQDQPLTVLPHEEYPSLTLSAGTYVIKGEFHWDKLPKTLFVSPEAGLIRLSVNGTAIANPDFNNEGRLWLTQNNDASSEDNLDIQVFRKISDSHPIQIVTSIQLRVSGKQRNVELKPVLLDGFIPLAITSELPARIENNKQLQVQLRPGEWTIEVASRALGNSTEFKLPESQQPWPSQEIWAFEADHTLRQVEVTGVPSIDPNQTKLPAAWNNLPAYLLNSQDVLTLNEQHRGAATNESTDIKLQRNMWLDFSGKGYTFQDRIDGRLADQTRLSVTPDMQLGRVAINGTAQLITQQGSSEAPDIGIEIRKQVLNLEADSRYEGALSTPPANGWQQELQGVNTTLHLPPGWRLLYASGMDNRPDTWLERWSLLDLFLVLIIALALGYMYGWAWGAFGLLALVFLWHEPNAPRWIWLNLLAVTALLQVVPSSLFKTLLHYYRLISFVLLALIVLPYMLDTIRTGLYPQLERNYYSTTMVGGYQTANSTGAAADVATDAAIMAEPATAPATVEEDANVVGNDEIKQQTPMPAPMPQAVIPKVAAKGNYISEKMSASNYKLMKRREQDLQSIDPNSMVQTGPGLPTWTWNSVELNWSGPIRADDRTYLFLINPMTTFLWKLLSIGLLLVLAWRVLWPKNDPETPTTLTSKWQHFKSDPLGMIKAPFVLILTVGMVFAMLLPSPSIAADIPNEQLLQTLKERLLKEPRCLPQCAQIETMQLQLQGEQLTARLKAHAAIDTAIPLPSSPNTWLPQQVLVDGNPTLALKRDNDQTLWVALTAGQHDITLQGTLPKRSNFALSLPLKPYRVIWEGAGWGVEGIRDNGVPEAQLQLTRTTSTEQMALMDHDATLPTFVKIERSLNLGLDWYIVTTVTRLSDSANPISISIPLLKGEQPMSDQFTIKDGYIKANFKAQENELVWSSRLNQTNELTLKAAANADYLEEWQLVASPIWHVQSNGLPVSEYREEEDTKVAVWKPWPNETLSFEITRPEGVAGQTVTILSSHLNIAPGKRAKDVTLTMSISSSRGTQHAITLPAGIEVKNLTIQDEKRPIQQQGDKLILPLNPMSQTVVVEWQDNSALDTYYRFPVIDLGLSSVNHTSHLTLAQDRWVLWVNGPDLGPAVLFWGVLLALLIVSILLGRANITPLKSWQWFLLAIGLSQSSPYLMVLMVLWLVAITQRENLTRLLPNWGFNSMQIGLLLLTFFALLSLFGAVANGLLGEPDMQITGFNSNAYDLNWYQDRTGTLLPQPVVFSVPILVYRLLMLLWALWLAITVLGWLRWGWKAFSTGGLWRHTPITPKTKVAGKRATPQPSTTNTEPKPSVVETPVTIIVPPHTDSPPNGS